MSEPVYFFLKIIKDKLWEYANKYKRTRYCYYNQYIRKLPEDELDKNYLKNNKNEQNQNSSILIDLSVRQLVQLGMHSSSYLTSYLIDKPANLTAELHLAYL